MRTVQIYVGRNVIDLDCIRVTFTLDGVTQTIDVPLTGMLNDKPKYEYNIDLSEGDYIITESGDYITSEEGEYLITENSIFTPSIYIHWDGTRWYIEFTINGNNYEYCLEQDIYYPFSSQWEICAEGNEFEYLITESCTDLKYERLELFDDEKINITLNVQNISDISKVQTDFSQSFTVPGSIVNNRIFEHFYQNDVDGTIDYNLKRPAYIEIDFIPFRKGVISLEKANTKNGLVDNYSITFYGLLTNLKDLFGEVKINQLDYSDIAFTYNFANVQNRITDAGTDYDVRFPLISNTRLWTYADGGTYDITTNGGSVEYTELFPAVKVARIFDAIEAYFGITFVSEFFTDDRFTKLFMQAKNAETMKLITQVYDIDFDSVSTTTSTGNNYIPDDYVDIPNNSITINSQAAFANQIFQLNIDCVVNTKSSATTAYLDVYKNGIYFQTINITTVGTYQILKYGGILSTNIIPIPNNSETFTFKLKAEVPMTIDLDFTYAAYYLNLLDPFGSYGNISTITTTSNILTANVDLRNYLPDMKVSDFFSGMLKEFNFTCVGIDSNTYQIEPLDNWYNLGSTIDVTPYIDVESVDISRVPLYRNISFKYQQSESFPNRQYFSISNSEYGNTNNVFNYDGGDFIIEQPFENLLFLEAQGTLPANKTILGYYLNQNYQSYIPKPTLLYIYGSTGTLPVNIKLYNGSTNVNLTSYILFGQDVTVGGVKYSLNWGADNSIIHKETIQNGLFATYYFSYLSNLYNLKQRLTSVKAMLPMSLLTNLQLNDRLIIRDKRYIINDIKMELTSGEAQLTLYNDFRDIDLSNYIIIGSGAQNVLLNAEYKSGSNLVTITRTPTTVTISPTTISWGIDDYRTKNFTVTVPANTTGFARQWVISKNYVNVGVINYILIQEA